MLITDHPLDFWVPRGTRQTKNIVQTLAGHDVVGEQARRSCAAGGIPQNDAGVCEQKYMKRHYGGRILRVNMSNLKCPTCFSLYINLNLAQKRMFL